MWNTTAEGNTTSAPTTSQGSHNSLLHFIVMTIQPSIGTLLTLFSIMVIVRHKKLLGRISNKFLVNLFMANCFASVSMVGYAALALYHIRHSTSGKNLQLTRVMLDEEVIFYIVVVTSMIISLVNRMAVTLDRLLAIKKPFFYQEKFTTRVFCIIVVVTLSIAALYFITLTICYIYLPLKTVMAILQISFVTVILNGFFILTVVNVIIFFAARKQLRAIAETRVNQPRRKQPLREYRLVCICFGIVLCFELCWSPCLGWFMYSLLKDKLIPSDLQFLACHLICLNNILDPLIYVWLSKDVKRELKRFLRMTRNKNNCTELYAYSDSSMSVAVTYGIQSKRPISFRYSTAL